MSCSWYAYGKERRTHDLSRVGIVARFGEAIEGMAAFNEEGLVTWCIREMGWRRGFQRIGKLVGRI